MEFSFQWNHIAHSNATMAPYTLPHFVIHLNLSPKNSFQNNQLPSNLLVKFLIAKQGAGIPCLGLWVCS